MKHKILPRTIATVALCMSGSLLSGSLLAQQNGGSPGSPTYPNNSGRWQSASPGSPRGQLSPTSRMAPERLSQLMSSPVKDGQGNDVGQIKDFVVYPATGRIQFAIISLSDQSGKMTAVPWSLIRSGSEPNTCTINATKDQLSGSQTFDANSWPDFSQPTTAQQIYSNYGIQPGRTGYNRPAAPGANGAYPETPATRNPQPPTTPAPPPQQ